jgi:2'-5' RNA ligase
VPRSFRRSLYRAVRRVWRSGGETALVIPVPAAHAAVAKWRNEEPPVVIGGMELHITVLYPFVSLERVGPEVEHSVAETLVGRKRFDFRLTRLCAFGTVVYLAPDPADPFIELTRSFWRVWPQYPPYSGAFESIVPHLTVGSSAEERDAERLEAALPIMAKAAEIRLMTRLQFGRWQIRRRYPLS